MTQEDIESFVSVEVDNLNLTELMERRDIPTAKRKRAVKALPETPLTKRVERKLSAESARAKYNAFYDITPVHAYATHLLATERPVEVRTAAILLLRISTMMRCCDMAHLLPHLYHDSGRHYVV